MNDQPNDESVREQRVNRIIADYLQAERVGRPIDSGALLRQHPDLAAELESFFAARAEFCRMAEPIAPAAPAEATGPFGVRETLDPANSEGSIHYFGDYELLEEIASGGMGVVYKARQVSLNRVVALKMILAGQLATPAEVKRFQREARAVANCDHPGIVPIYEVGEHAGRHYFTMKLIAGNNLAHDLPHFRTHLRAAAYMLAQVAHAVQHAHERGLLHRDLKPANILLDAGKRPHVTDFGLATQIKASATLSRTGQIVGTASYMSPEQAAAQHRELSPATDIYSLGAILYEILTGRPPFRGKTVLDTLRQVVEQEPSRPRAVNPALHRDLETICLKCMDRRPQRRYTSADALAVDLENWVESRPIKARPVRRAERAWLWCRRQPRVVGLSAAAVVLALLVGSGLAMVNYMLGSKAEADAIAANARETEERKRRELADLKAKEAKKAQEAVENLARYEQDMHKAGTLAEEEDYPALRQLLQNWQPVANDPDYRQWEWYYLRAVAARASFIPPQKADPRSPDEWYFTLPGPGNIQPIVRLIWSPDSRRLAVYDDSGWLRVLELASGKQLFAYQVESRPKGQQFAGWASLGRLDAWSPDGKRLALSAPGGAVKILDAATGKPLVELPPMRTRVPSYVSNRIGNRAIAWSPDGLKIAASNGDPQVPIYDSSTGKEVLSLPGHEGAVLAVAWSADGRHLASGGADGKIKVWDVRAGREVCTLAEDAPVIALAWRPDGRRLVTSRAALDKKDNQLSRLNKGCTLWDTDKQQVVWTVLATVWHSSEFVWSSDGARLALGLPSSYDQKQASVGRPGTPEGQWQPEFYDQKANQLLDAASGRVLYRGDSPISADRELRRAAQRDDGGGQVRMLILELPSGNVERILVPWLSRYNPAGFPVFERIARSAWSPDGNTLALAGTKGSLQIRHLPREGKRNLTLVVPDVKRIDWGPDSRHFTINQTWTGSLPLDWADQKALMRRGSPGLAQDGTSPVALSPDGKRLAVALENKEIQLWDAASGQRTLRLAGHQQRVSVQYFGSPSAALLWSPHGKYLASYRAAECTLKVWDVATGAEIFGADLGPENHSHIGWAWHPDDTQIALSWATHIGAGPAVGRAGETSVWDVATGLRKRMLTSDVFGHLAWSPDGRLLACAHELGTEIWDPIAGKKLKERIDNLRVCCLAWDPESRRLAWATTDNRGATYDFKSQKVVPFKPDVGRFLAWQPDGKQLAVTNNGGSPWYVTLIDAENGAKISTVPGQLLAWTPGGLIARTTFDPKKNVVEIKNTTLGAVVEMKLPSNELPRPVLPLTNEQPPPVWRVTWDNGKPTGKYLDPAHLPRFWSPDRKHFAAIRDDQENSRMVVVVHDAAGKAEHEFVGDERRQFRMWLKGVVAWSPDSKLLAGGGNHVHVWDVAARKEVYRLLGHEGGQELAPGSIAWSLESIAWSPDGRRIVTRSRVVHRDTWELKVWDAAAGRDREILHVRGLVAELVFNPDLTACSFLQAATESPPAPEFVLWDLTGARGLAGE